MYNKFEWNIFLIFVVISHKIAEMSGGKKKWHNIGCAKEQKQIEQIKQKRKKKYQVQQLSNTKTVETVRIVVTYGWKRMNVSSIL